MCSWECLPRRGAGVPAGGWPRAQLRVEDAKAILDVQKVKMLASEQKAWCPSRRLEQRCFRGGGQTPEGSMNLWLGPLLVLIPVVFGFRLVRPRSCFRQSDQESSLKLGDRKQVTVYMSCPPASFAYTLLPTAARTQGVQQAASCAGNAGVAAVQVQAEQVEGKHFWQNCASVFDSTTVPWSQVRRNARFMLLPQ